MIKDETLLISTSGFETGVINGLTVMTIGDYTFGKPARITANTYMGKSGVINVERETDMSGPSHSKGVMILSGYLGETFAQDFPLSLTASLCFEQLYNGVDGDSASSTEAYAILSSLSDIPINQSLAVTGSVNQKGFIQPIGGVNEKVEGFYQVCKDRGLNGEHGVIIPIQNVRNLHLSDEVIESVKEGKFHVYAVSTLDEGIEILTGVPAGKKDKNGNNIYFDEFGNIVDNLTPNSQNTWKCSIKNTTSNTVLMSRKILLESHQQFYFKSLKYRIKTILAGQNLYRTDGARGASSGGTFFGFIDGINNTTSKT